MDGQLYHNALATKDRRNAELVLMLQVALLATHLGIPPVDVLVHMPYAERIPLILAHYNHSRAICTWVAAGPCDR